MADRLKSLFGPDRVLRNATHEGAAVQGETDVLIDLDDDALIVECKAHTLTAAGRRGAPARIETKTEEILEKAFEQVTKGRNHLRARLPFAAKGGHPRFVHLRDAPDLLGLVVSFERIDPMFMHTALRRFGDEVALAIGLPDFLSITDLVRWPSAFYYYVSERSKLLSLENVRATTEQDYLGVFLVNQKLGALAGTAPEVDRIWIDGYGPALNRVLAVPGDRFRAPNLPYPPKPVLGAFKRTLEGPSAGWAATVQNAHSIPATEWRTLKGMLRHLRPRASTPRIWKAADGQLTIRVATPASVRPQGDLLEIGELDL